MGERSEDRREGRRVLRREGKGGRIKRVQDGRTKQRKKEEGGREGGKERRMQE